MGASGSGMGPIWSRLDVESRVAEDPAHGETAMAFRRLWLARRGVRGDVGGGGTGIDKAGWCAARAAGIPTGGWMTRGFPTEAPDGHGDESRPEFAEMYRARAAIRVE
jgi:hypothetical protein